jgi:hypothetical protein
MEPVDSLVVRDAEQDEVRKCTLFVFGHRLVVARAAWKGAAYAGNLDVDDRLVADKADNSGAAVREIAGALGSRVTEMKLLKTPLAPHSRMLVARWRGDRWVAPPTRNQPDSKAGHPRSMFGPTIMGTRFLLL